MTDLPTREEIVHRVRFASARRDIATLAELLDPAVVALVDGAGDVIAPTTAVIGSDAVIGELRRTLSPPTAVAPEVTLHPVNSAPALVVRADGRVVAIVGFGIVDGLVHQIWITRSPQKLARWNASR
ncbi:hypothetical protein BH09ACT4_BH09ACT4_12490 [soil metagenome]